MSGGSTSIIIAIHVRLLVIETTQGEKSMSAKNILGGDLQPCSMDPLTGFFRDGCCNTGPHDRGRHTVCAVVTEEFLLFSRAMGNDLISPRPEYGFSGLKPGDRWCLCADRWREAAANGVVAPVVPEATHAAAADHLGQYLLISHAVDSEPVPE